MNDQSHIPNAQSGPSALRARCILADEMQPHYTTTADRLRDPAYPNDRFPLSTQAAIQAIERTLTVLHNMQVQRDEFEARSEPPAGARDAVTELVEASIPVTRGAACTREQMERFRAAVGALTSNADGPREVVDYNYNGDPIYGKATQPAATGAGDIDYIGPPATMPTDHEKWMALYVIRMVERGIDADSAWALCRAGESDHDYGSDPAEAADNEITVFDHDGDMA